MYEQFFWLGVAAIFFALYAIEASRGDEGFLLKDFWMVAGLIMLFASFFFNYTLTSTVAVPNLNGSTTTYYNYAVYPDLSSYAYGVGMILVAMIFIFLYSGLRTLWAMKK